MQDFWSTIFLSNLESILTQDAQEKLNANISEEQLKRNVNIAVSFNTIKNAAFELFASPKYSKDKEALFTKLTELFMMKPCEKRKDRNTPRLKLSSHRKIFVYGVNM